MTPKFKISIPEPCHEDWSKMTPTEKGRHCKACSKEVIDFTHFSNEALHKRITQGESLCGRFLPHQLDTPLTIERKKNSISFSKIAATLALPLSVISTNISNAQESKPKTEQTINTSKTYTSLGIGMQHRPLKPLTSTLSGTVTDESGLPLPGVNIIVKGTTRGTQTDFDGNYSITANTGDVLVFSYVGYADQEVAVSASNTISVSLQLDSQLDEVVVTALGIKRKQSEITTANQNVKSEELSQAANPNVVQSLTGKVSGLQINTTSNGVNPNSKVTIRGNNSISGDNSALVVIDGVISNLSVLNNLPPEIIESVNVIKGVQGAALYGDAAANGLITVTTKGGGKKENVSVTFNTSTQFQTVSFVPERQTKYGQGWNGEHINYENGGWGPEFDLSLIHI